ncbi:MAG: hypothetical protein O7G86_13410, partial [Gammaproteobacteria bacterium]|nr:hypothetical protein [Gammaproteobacteria bacterium]
AWILVTGTVDQDTEDDYGLYDVYSAGAEDDLPDYDGTFADSADGYPDIESLLPAAVSLDNDDDKEKSTPRELAVEVPDGYELHKLERKTE